MKKTASERGTTLIEAFVALGLMGLIGWYLAGMLKNGTLGQKTLQAQDDSRVLTDSIAQLLSDPVACANTFGGAAASGNGNVFPGISYTGPHSVPNGATPITNVLDAHGNVQFTWGKVYGNRSLTLNSIYIGGNGTDAKTGIQAWTPGSGAAAHTGIAFAQVSWQQTGNAANQQGPRQLTKFFMVSVTHLSLGPPTDLLPVNAIVSCTAQSASSSGTGFWQLNTNTGSISNTNQVPAGQPLAGQPGGVGIGTETPLGALDVYTASGRHFLVDAATGNVGVGTPTPQATLDVNGGIHPGAAVTGNSCPTGTPEGTIAYDSTTQTQHALVYCNGHGSSGTWVAVAAPASGSHCGLAAVGCSMGNPIVAPVSKCFGNAISASVSCGGMTGPSPETITAVIGCPTGYTGAYTKTLLVPQPAALSGNQTGIVTCIRN